MKRYRHDNRAYGRAFTIVELIVVIIIIAILAAISVVSYSAITKNARVSTLKGDLTRASSSLLKEKTERGSYPATQAAASEFLIASDDVTLTYVYDNDEKTYCLAGTIQQEIYHITSGKTEAVQGSCP